VSKEKPDYYNDLNKIYLKIWNLLNEGLKNRNDPLHIPSFICGQDKFFDARIVVLRGIDQEKKLLWFNTDIRSNKIKILKSNPRASLLFYSKNEKIQLRVQVKVKINYQNNLTEKSWKKTAHMSRQCYLGSDAPGTNTLKATSGLTEKVDNLKYSIEESESGYKNFCVIENYISSMEWLYLAAKGHRRAKFSFKNENIIKEWLIP
jgi:pyridoxamine 5'-phosphate oxidase